MSPVLYPGADVFPSLVTFPESAEPTRFEEAIRNPPAIYVRVEVWRGGVRVDPYGDDGLPVYGGQVDVDRSRQVRRMLTGVSVDATDATWDLLSPVGTELRAWRGFRYSNGDVEAVSLGHFVVPNLSEVYGGDWDGQIGSAPDRMSLVQRARFTVPRVLPEQALIRDVLNALMSEVVGPVTDMASSLALVPADAVYERDRAKAISELAASIGAEAVITANGTPMIRDLPTLGDPVWTVDAGDNGVLYTASRERSHERTYSGVVAAPAQVDGALPFDPQIVWDEEPLSPTWHLGPFGEVPYFFTSPLFGSEDQARAAALARLPLVTGARNSVSLTAECNPALSDGDTILVRFPPRQWSASSITERHLVESLTIPLTPDGVQRIETRSTSPDMGDSD